MSIGLARSVVLERLSSDYILVDRTDLCVADIMKAFDMSIWRRRFFVNNQTMHQQQFRCPMGSPLSSVLACMVLKVIEQNAIETFSKPPSMWVRYVNDVYTIAEANQTAVFHDQWRILRVFKVFSEHPDNLTKYFFLNLLFFFFKL